MASEVHALAPAPAPAEQRVAVIDVGSNSVRLVVFDRLERQPFPVFNEKTACGLGRGFDKNGRLDAASRDKAVAVLERFARLVQAMQVSRVRVLATAAVRDAVDGAAFVAKVKARTGFVVEILSGAEEARLAAQGVLCGTPGADGVMGDIGGGSLELVALDGGRIGSYATLPLGLLRLSTAKFRTARQLSEHIDEQLAGVGWLDELRGRTLYAVGGGWRSLARAHIHDSGYPLRVIHGYELSHARAEKLVRTIAGGDVESLKRTPRLSRGRAELAPFAAQVMWRLLLRAEPARVSFSAYGLREGWLFDQLPAAVQAEDPLLAACRRLATEEGRFPVHGDELVRWTSRLFPGESPARERLRLAACLLSDIAWRMHPETRHEEALLRVLWAPMVGIDHKERVFVALAIYSRYTSQRRSGLAERVAKLINADAARRARILGLALRLGHTITGGASGLLDSLALEPREGALCLIHDQSDALLIGEAVRARFSALARAMDMTAHVETRDS